MEIPKERTFKAKGCKVFNLGIAWLVQGTERKLEQSGEYF